MINQTSNNFQALTGSICNLNHGQNTAGNSAFQGVSAQGNNGESFQQEGFNGSFSGFQQNVGQQYSLDNQQTSQLLSLFVEVLSEIMSNVITNSGTSSVGNNTSALPQQPSVDQNMATATPTTNTSAVDAPAEPTTPENAVESEKTAPASCPFSG